LVSLCATACSSGAAATQPQQLTLLSGIAQDFTNDLIQRFNTALPQTHVGLQPTSGGVVVVSAVSPPHDAATSARPVRSNSVWPNRRTDPRASE